MSKPKIAFQGAPGAFSHQAAQAFVAELGEEAQTVACQTFGEVFQKVASGAVQYGAIPLENSSIGSIVANYDLLWSNDAQIISEYFLPVHHQLIGFAGVQISDIKVVFSHPAALDQCRGLFSQHPGMAPRVHWDTSGAVAHVKEAQDKTYAAIAGELAAQEYGMAIIEANVEDFSHNATRFGLIAAQAIAGWQAPEGGTYKLSCAVELAHKPGSLAVVLNGLAALAVNLTKIESRPIGASAWHYRFFLDIEVNDVAAEPKIVSLLKNSSDHCKILGRYVAAKADSKPLPAGGVAERG